MTFVEACIKARALGVAQGSERFSDEADAVRIRRETWDSSGWRVHADGSVSGLCNVKGYENEPEYYEDGDTFDEGCVLTDADLEAGDWLVVVL